MQADTAARVAKLARRISHQVVNLIQPQAVAVVGGHQEAQAASAQAALRAQQRLERR